MKKYCFGIDVGGTTVKCGLFTVEGEVLDKWEIKTRTEDNGINILPDVAETINQKIQEKNIEKESVAGIGIGVPGPVNEAGEVPCAVNLHWGYVNIVGDLERLTGLPVKAGNDANVAALGELWKGGGAGYHSLIMVTLGTGVGGGIIINEKIVAGSHGAGGEIGHAHVEDAITDPCNCGNCGCLEQVASATGIVRLAKEALASTEAPSLLRDQEVTAKAVWDAVKEKDAVAIQVAERFGNYLGKTLAVFATVADPQVIVIGGGVSKAGTILLDYVTGPFRKYAFSACRETEFALATLGNDAGIFGAAKMVI
ncbi:MAG: ROK family glucokinase [Lachnospiraceae bacterium]|nr:ROK family glucokinase [Lachnospiraceae bacterium]MDD7078671.1 ROK family glucokinase [Lachnospiraceae bacterium]MDY3729325.1 ROK family glucokinase [Candidatus Choladocola sp.]